MENKMTVRTEKMPAVCSEVQPAPINQYYSYPVYDEKAGKLIDEVIVATRDERMNTKRSISADIAITARVQNQNENVIKAFERELLRKDLPEGDRMKLLEMMSNAAESSANESAASRKFQKEQLGHSHELPWKILGWGAIILIGGIGGTALFNAATKKSATKFYFHSVPFSSSKL